LIQQNVMLVRTEKGTTEAISEERGDQAAEERVRKVPVGQRFAEAKMGFSGRQ
jgi:hypothetical protein